MDFCTWEPVYERILADFGYERAGDERARDVLVELLADRRRCSLDSLSFADETVAIAGGGPTLAADLSTVRSADSVVAASVAARDLSEYGISTDAMVTDLDKTPEFARQLTREGVPVAVHAHGDNISAVEEYVPTFETRWVIPTTQAAPADPVANVGGFTDGDRAAFLADELGADRLVFAGWDFDDPTVSAEKTQKLQWAQRLLLWLERRRGERFGVLDGRRERVAADVLSREE